jgi:L-alanine-DL-glutamate epimerase-like enolase superfamily enzyme
VKLELQRRSLRLAAPLQSSYGAVRDREMLTVAITDGEGATGHGEAAPLELYDGVSIAEVERALQSYRPVLAKSDGSHGARLVEACRRAADLPAALAAIDMALWDRAGRREGKPIGRRRRCRST